MDGRKEIIERYYNSARNELVDYAERRSGNRDVAEDVVQDAFVRLLSADCLLSEATLPALTFTIVRNLLTDRYRRMAYLREYAGERLHTATPAGDAAELCSRHEVEQWLERGMARLPEKSAEAYRLHIMGGMKIGDIRKATGHDYKQLERWLGAARKQMRQYMKRIVS
ncbi:MAG: RNA polymerase sigma factor [Prevotella sp.]